MCTQLFLSELQRVLPSPEQVSSIPNLNLDLTIYQVGKLNVYKNADASELENLHPADRLMVQLIKMKRLGPRIEGMLYKLTFEETWGLMDEVLPSLVFTFNHKFILISQGSKILSEAGRQLLNAKHFKELLSVQALALSLTITTDPYYQLILLVGNYMNGTGIKGGAFGFRVSSINKVSLTSLPTFQRRHGFPVGRHKVCQQHDTTPLLGENRLQTFPFNRGILN
jgi:cytokinesis protein